MNKTCSSCKKQLKGKDLERLKKRKEDKSYFESQVDIPMNPFKFAEINDYIDSIFYCQDCVNQVKNWEQKDKHCITCDFLVMNFINMPYTPDIYCRRHDNKAVYEPKEESCEDWLLAYVFKK